jgi:4'-phosphopantetheinyl transferase
LENNLVHVFYIRHPQKIKEELFQQLLHLLPSGFQETILSYKHRESAQASLLGKVLLQYGLNRLESGVTLDAVQFTAKERPFLNEKIDFNISHSGEYVIAAIAENLRVGIDVEKHRLLDVALFRRYFDVDEWSLIESAADSMQTFFDFWAIKESAIKCDGRGVEVLSETHVRLKKQEHPAMPMQVSCAGELFSYRKILLDEKYSCSICSNHPFTINLTETGIGEVLKPIR